MEPDNIFEICIFLAGITLLCIIIVFLYFSSLYKGRINKLQSLRIEKIMEKQESFNDLLDTFSIKNIETDRRLHEIKKGFVEFKESIENSLISIEDKIYNKKESTIIQTGITERDIFKEMKKQVPSITQVLYDPKNPDHKRERGNAYRRLYRKIKREKNEPKS